MKYKGDESLPRAARPAEECFVHDDRGQTGDERIPQSGSTLQSLQSQNNMMIWPRPRENMTRKHKDKKYWNNLINQQAVSREELGKFRLAVARNTALLRFESYCHFYS